MKCRVVELCGQQYPLRFSLRVVRDCTERYGSIENIFNAMQVQEGQEGGQIVDEILWLLGAMLDAGYRYARLNGESTPAPPDADTLLDVLDIQDAQRTLMDAMVGDSVRTVEAESEKNGRTAAETVSSPPPGSSGME